MNKSNLLMVDDSPYMHKMVRAYLEPEPLMLHSVYDGASAIRQAAELKPSLILMDIDMPEMDGLEACRRLKASPTGFNIPIIFLTADCSMNDKVKALDMGAVDYITKPFKPEELRARVRSALRTKQRIEQTQMVDATTGLWNQAYLELQTPVLLSLAHRTALPMSCIVGELDRFEKISVKHGSEFEDKMIKAAAKVFLAETRAEDVICYCGQGRFVSLIPATKREGANLLAERIRAEIERELHQVEEHSVNITGSFGVSDTLVGGHLSLIDAADSAMVRSKTSKGNKTTVAEAASDKTGYAA